MPDFKETGELKTIKQPSINFVIYNFVQIHVVFISFNDDFLSCFFGVREHKVNLIV